MTNRQIYLDRLYENHTCNGYLEKKDVSHPVHIRSHEALDMFMNYLRVSYTHVELKETDRYRYYFVVS